MNSLAQTATKPSKNGKAHDLKLVTAGQEGVDYTPAFSNYAGKVPLGIDETADSLAQLTGGWPKCISGVLCYVEGGEFRVLEDASALFAWVASKAPVEWKRGSRAVTKEEFFKRLHQRKRYEWATPHPHFPKVKGVYYLGKRTQAENTGKLDELLDRFCPKTWKDRELIRALVLTLFWGGPPGKRPQFVVVADEAGDPDAGRGTGKTSLVQYLGELVGGCIDVAPSGDRGRTLSNLLSPASWGKRIALIDNLKTVRYSNDFLERLVTRMEITGHRLYSGFASRPNLLTWVVTVNGAYFSTDMARRSVVIRLDRPEDTPVKWDAETLKFIEENREEIAADVRWHLEVKKPAPLKKIDTWGPWCMDVLFRCKNPNDLLKHTGNERNKIDADKQEVELALDHLRGCIASHFEEDGEKAATVDNSLVWAPSAWYVQALRSLKRDFTDRQAQQFLPRLASSGRLKRLNKKTQKGYLRVGPLVDEDDPPPERVITYRPDAPGLRHKKK